MDLPPIVVPKRFRIIAHRGASAYAPENTLAAMRLAREMGAREVELDAQLAADGVVMVCHDRTLERYGHGGIVVEETPSRELLQLDMGSWFSPHFYALERMATLRGLLEKFRDEFAWHVEIKGECEGLEAAVAKLLREFHLANHTVVTSFRAAALERTREADATLRLGLLVERLDDAALAEAARLGLHQLCPHAANVTPEGVAAAKKIVREVRAWGVSGPPAEVRATVRRLVDCGADGMTINWPDWATHG